jgi:adenosylmethionine-8-amino-7-oxononanoate aminotransferase
MSPPDRKTLEAWDDAHVWHPFTSHTVYRDENPLMIERGDGSWLVDVNGKRFLDAVGSLWCNILGHRRPEIDEAITSQLGRIAHATFLGNASVPAVELAKRLADLAPGNLTKVFYSDSGSTTVEIAVKMALQFWQQEDDGKQAHRQRFLSFGQAYHGDTVGSVSVGGMSLFHTRFAPLLFGVERVRSPYEWRALSDGDDACWLKLAVDDLSATLDNCGDQIAAILMEPGMQGAAGMLTQPPGYAKAVRALADKHGTLLIVDEVAMGMGRSGALFASDTLGIVPDFLCLAKGLTGGYLPLAATLTTERIFNAFLGDPAEGRTFFHGHTYTGNALGAAAALATLDILTNGVLDTLPNRVADLRSRLVPLMMHPSVVDVRQFGLAVGIELLAGDVVRCGMAVCQVAATHGVFMRPLGDVLVLMPPLTISDNELDILFSALQQSIDTVLSGAV